MATKKTTRTSKTAHVLNLRTEVGDVKEEEQAAAQAPKAAAPSPVAAAPSPKPAMQSRKAAPRPSPSPAVESMRAGNEAIESKIRAALEETTQMEVRSVPHTPPAAQQILTEENMAEEEIAEDEQEAVDEPVEDMAEADETPGDTAEADETLGDTAEANETPGEAEEAATATSTQRPEEDFSAALQEAEKSLATSPEKPTVDTDEKGRGSVEESYASAMPQLQKDIAVGEEMITCVNVMQALVEEKSDRYIEMFGLCNCQRCRVDVMALALTKLPSKYVVSKKRESIPMLTVYESRYSAAVISQVIWACKQVMDSPRHEL